MKIREKKISIAKFHEAHYKVSDLLAAIMKKTLMFLNSSQKMKENIVKAEPEGVVLDIVDAPQYSILYLVFRYISIKRLRLYCSNRYRWYFNIS